MCTSICSDFIALSLCAIDITKGGVFNYDDPIWLDIFSKKSKMVETTNYP